MKVLLINGSPHKEGNTFLALSEAAKTLHEEGVETQIVHIGVKPLAGCIACGKCRETGKCVFADDVYNTLCQRRLALYWTAYSSHAARTWRINLPPPWPCAGAAGPAPVLTA